MSEKSCKYSRQVHLDRDADVLLSMEITFIFSWATWITEVPFKYIMIN